jgi:hypothetical protein
MPHVDPPVGSSSLPVALLCREPLQEARHEDRLDGGADLEDELVAGGDAKARGGVAPPWRGALLPGGGGREP